jgi:hypothetical protein
LIARRDRDRKPADPGIHANTFTWWTSHQRIARAVAEGPAEKSYLEPPVYRTGVDHDRPGRLVGEYNRSLNRRTGGRTSSIQFESNADRLRRTRIAGSRTGAPHAEHGDYTYRKYGLQPLHPESLHLGRRNVTQDVAWDGDCLLSPVMRVIKRCRPAHRGVGITSRGSTQRRVPNSQIKYPRTKIPMMMAAPIAIPRARSCVPWTVAATKAKAAAMRTKNPGLVWIARQ